MNSAQRRKKERKWLRKNKTEVDRVLRWIKESPDYVAPEFVKNNDIIDMKKPKIAAFGGRFAYGKSYWIYFLKGHNVNIL